MTHLEVFLVQHISMCGIAIFSATFIIPSTCYCLFRTKEKRNGETWHI